MTRPLHRPLLSVLLAAALMAAAPTLATASSTPTTAPTTLPLAPSGTGVMADQEATLEDLAQQVLAIQERLTVAAAEYEASQKAASDARAQVDVAQRRAQEAARVAREHRTVLGQYASSLFRGAAVTGDGMALRAAMSGVDSTLALAENEARLQQVTARQDEEVARAVRAVEEAERLSAEAQEASEVADAQEAEAEALLARTRAEAATLAADLSEHLARMGGAAVSDAAQAERNNTALDRWTTWLRALADASIVPPPASALADPSALPPGMVPVVNEADRPVPGVAQVVVDGTPTTVLPAETVEAVSAAFARVGSPYVAGRSGPEAFDCSGLTRASWQRAGIEIGGDVAGQWADGPQVPLADVQVGDLVFYADDEAGLHHVAIYIGQDQVLDSSATLQQVGVHTLDEDAVYGAVRPTAPDNGAPSAAPLAAGDKEMVCDAEVLPAPVLAAGGAPATAAGSSGSSGKAWGGYSNGTIPESALCPIGDGHRMRCDAAAAFAVMSAAYAADHGRPICVTDSYRSFAGQVSLYARKPALAAVPGTSTHGWALALDLCGGINSFGTPEHRWMQAHAATYGYHHPDWAQATGSKPEAWHWEFRA